MASDLQQRLEAEMESGYWAGVPECLVKIERAAVRHGLGFVDDRTAISEDLTNEVYRKANRMVTSYRQPGGVRNHPGFCQMGFVRGEPLPVSPGGNQHFKVYPVTARHNYRNYVNPKDGKEYYAIRTEVVYGTEFGEGSEMHFPGMNWKPNASDKFWIRDESVVTRRPAVWPFGVDVAEGDMVSTMTKGITDEYNSFEPVRRTFCLEAGQKVGIAVLFTEKSRPNAFSVAGCDEEQKKISTDELKRIYGEPEVVNVYTGQITYVGEKHIEYDINTFTSCSGAIVFLLDEKQPESVQECDHGKAVAVHGGAHPFISARNFGFKLRGNVPRILPHVCSS